MSDEAPESAPESAPAPDAREPASLPEPGLPQVSVDMLYRVLCLKSQMPSLQALLERLIAKNPYNPEGGFVFPPPGGIRRLQDALGANPDFFCMGYLREEAPELFESAKEALKTDALLFDEDDRLRVERAELCVVLRAQLKSPEDNRYVETLCHLADAFQSLQHGAVWDVNMRRLWSRDGWRDVMGALLSPLSHVRVVTTEHEIEPHATLRTVGLKKFGSHDLELCRVPLLLTDDVSSFLLDVSESLMHGELFEVDDVIRYRDVSVRLVAAPEQDGNRVLRLVDGPQSEEEELAATTGAEGAPKLVSAVHGARIEVEGRRARGGIGAM